MKAKQILSILLCVLLMSGMLPCALSEEAAKKPILMLMAAELPEWAVIYNETAQTPLTVQDIAIRLYDDDSYVSTLLSAEKNEGTYTYSMMTGEYTLSGGGAVVEGTENHSFMPKGEGMVEYELLPYEDINVLVAQLTGEAEILASGQFPMVISFTLSLYDNDSFELTNLASPAAITGSWKKASDGSVVLTGEGVQMLYSTFDADHQQASLAVKAFLSEYEFTLILKGRIQ